MATALGRMAAIGAVAAAPATVPMNDARHEKARRSRGSLLARTKRWAGAIRRDAFALWLAARDPRVRLLPKILAAVVAAYAFSPIDLIPDFIPVLGYIDDLIIVPLGIALAVKLIPPVLIAELRIEAQKREKPVSVAGMVLIAATWASASIAAGMLLLR